MPRRRKEQGSDEEWEDDRERDKRERRKFMDASKMRRVSIIYFFGGRYNFLEVNFLAPSPVIFSKNEPTFIIYTVLLKK